jgi:hypothetical protein
MGSGYEQHARLIGSPVGKLVASERDKERARPLLLHGPWGRFDEVLQQAIDGSVTVLERTWALVTAEDREQSTRRLELEQVLPGGTIDGAGEGVNLDRPFAVVS